MAPSSPHVLLQRSKSGVKAPSSTPRRPLHREHSAKAGASRTLHFDDAASETLEPAVSAPLAKTHEAISTLEPSIAGAPYPVSECVQPDPVSRTKSRTWDPILQRSADVPKSVVLVPAEENPPPSPTLPSSAPGHDAPFALALQAERDAHAATRRDLEKMAEAKESEERARRAAEARATAAAHAASNAAETASVAEEASSRVADEVQRLKAQVAAQRFAALAARHAHGSMHSSAGSDLSAQGTQLAISAGDASPPEVAPSPTVHTAAEQLRLSATTEAAHERIAILTSQVAQLEAAAATAAAAHEEHAVETANKVAALEKALLLLGGAKPTDGHTAALQQANVATFASGLGARAGERRPSAQGGGRARTTHLRSIYRHLMCWLIAALALALGTIGTSERPADVELTVSPSAPIPGDLPAHAGGHMNHLNLPPDGSATSPLGQLLRGVRPAARGLTRDVPESVAGKRHSSRRAADKPTERPRGHAKKGRRVDEEALAAEEALKAALSNHEANEEGLLSGLLRLPAAPLQLALAACTSLGAAAMLARAQWRYPLLGGALVALGLIEFGETVSGLVTTPEAAVRDGERDGERKEQGTWSSTR